MHFNQNLIYKWPSHGHKITNTTFKFVSNLCLRLDWHVTLTALTLKKLVVTLRLTAVIYSMAYNISVSSLARTSSSREITLIHLPILKAKLIVRLNMWGSSMYVFLFISRYIYSEIGTVNLGEILESYCHLTVMPDVLLQSMGDTLPSKVAHYTSSQRQPSLLAGSGFKSWEVYTFEKDFFFVQLHNSASKHTQRPHKNWVFNNCFPHTY